MKNITKSLIALLAIVSFSCTDDIEDRPVVVATDAPILSAPATSSSYQLTLEGATNLAERFVWTSANFDQAVAVNYEIQLDLASGDFTAPRVLGSVIGENNLSVSQVTLNTAVIALGGEPELEGQYAVRVKASVNDTFEPMYSEPVLISVTPYQAFVPLQNLYVVGTATEFGFDNNAGNTPLFRDPTNQYLFNIKMYLSAGELKFLANLGAWQPQYGTNDGTTLADSSNGDPGAITVPNSGYYDITVNIDTNEFSLVPFDATAAVTYGTIGITGSATPEGWPDNGIMDVDMTASAANPHIWKVRGLALSVNEAKFRANDAWDTNWGGTTAVSGTATMGGSNIPVTAEGNYDVWFNDIDGKYIFIMR